MSALINELVVFKSPGLLYLLVEYESKTKFLRKITPHFENESQRIEEGDIYVGTIAKYAAGINGYFINFLEKQNAFLPARFAYNKSLKIGDNICFQIKRAKSKMKAALATCKLAIRYGSFISIINNKPGLIFSFKLDKTQISRLRNIILYDPLCAFLVRSSAKEKSNEQLVKEYRIILIKATRLKEISKRKILKTKCLYKMNALEDHYRSIESNKINEIDLRYNNGKSELALFKKAIESLQTKIFLRNKKSFIISESTEMG
jgi:Ribonuclease G/E